MAVQVETLDILTERAHFDPEVARAVGDAITVEVNAARDTLATKADLLLTKADLQREIADVRQDITDVRRDITDVRQDIADVRQKISALRSEMHAEIANVKTDIIKFVFTALATQMALLVGIMLAIIQYLRV